MKQFQKQLKKQAGSIKLSAAEKRDLKERLVTYMEYHPLPEAETKAAAALESETFTVWRPSAFMVRNLLGTFVLVLIIGVPIAAERTVPGDVLYPVKVQFNEEVRGSLTMDPYDKVVWETERLERRIAEARLLAEEGKLTPEAEAQVAAAVRAHSDAAQEEIETLRTTDSDEAAIAEIAFNSALDVQSAVLRSEQERTSTTANGLSGVNTIAFTVDAERTESATRQTGQVVSIERLNARVEMETTRAFEYLETVKEYASATELSDIERRLADIERKIQRAYDEETTLEVATQALREALASTQKLIVFMTDIDVRENVSIEDLVPVELTDEERAIAFAEAVARIETNSARIEAALTEEDNYSVVEKASEAIEVGEAALKAVADNAEAKVTIELEVQVYDADELLGDIVRTLDTVKPVAPDATEEPEDRATTTPEVEGTASSTDAVASTTDPTPDVAGISSTTGSLPEDATNTPEELTPEA